MTAGMAGLWAPVVVLRHRGVGTVQFLREWLPGWGIEAFAVVTGLGDSVTLVAVAVLVYLAYDRGIGSFVLGALFVGFAVTILAKTVVAVPRPPTELQYVAASGFGFPSGHAVGATVGWGALAVALERVWTLRRRTLVAGVVVVVVGLSRVAIGVHYLVDVLVGTALGLVVLAVAVRWLRDDPLALFGLAGGVAAAAVAATGGSLQTVGLLGLCAGAIVGWLAVEPADRPWGRSGLVSAVGLVGLVSAGATALDPVSGAVFGGAALVTAAVLVVPVGLERRGGPSGRRLAKRG